MNAHRIRDSFRPSSYARKVREGGFLRATAWYLGLIAGLIQVTARWVAADARRRWESEPTEQQARGLFLIGVPVGVALILIAVGNGFGL